MIQAPEHIRRIAPYQGGKPISELARELGLDEAKIVKLASNENPLGMPASARRAIEASLADAARYPDGNAFSLKRAISARTGVPADWITIGNGSNDILELVVRALVSPGESTVYSEHAFAVYPLATQAVGATGIVVPAVKAGPERLGHDLDAMLAAIRPDTRIVFVANPNNPTGTFLPAERIEAFLEKVPANVVVVYDEAYTEYLPPDIRPDAVQWVKRFPNLLVTRSFSKAYGLGGLRVGYGLSHPAITDLLNRVRMPFNVSVPALAAAEAAFQDDAFLQRGYEANLAGLQQVERGLAALGLDFIPSRGNFVLFEVASAAPAGQSLNGVQVYDALLREGVIVRPVGAYGLPGWLRVSIGLPAENEVFLAALKKVLGR